MERVDTRVRRAVVDDAAVIALILLRSFSEFHPQYTPGGFAATTPTEQQIRARFDEGPVWLAGPMHNALGTVSAVHVGAEVKVRSMAVLPEARGKRIGEMLLEEVQHYAREQLCRRLVLNTTPFLTGAIRLYERSGFTAVGMDDLFGTPLITMEKYLD